LFITFRLAGSLPRAVIEELMAERQWVEERVGQITDPTERARQIHREERRLFEKWDAALDAHRQGPRWLADHRIANLVAESLHSRDGKVYTLHALCIMPNHVHLVCTPLEKPDGTYHSLPAILHSLKHYTAREANLILGRLGAFWQAESYDHVVRDEGELRRIIAYVLNNPVEAGLVSSWEEWPWNYSRADCQSVQKADCQSVQKADCQSALRGKVWRFGDGVSTDHIIPGRYYHLRGDLKALAEHALEDADPDFAQKAQPGDFVVAGKNFGQGSSREHAPLVLKERGIQAVLAQSFARIFFRNAVNVGLVPIICETEGFETGDEIEVDLEKGTVRNIAKGFERSFTPLPPIMRAILADGGLIPHVLKHGRITNPFVGRIGNPPYEEGL
jgi:3-isopropylmalate/(R)-2-methylmalate dehydratase small subunit